MGEPPASGSESMCRAGAASADRKCPTLAPLGPVAGESRAPLPVAAT